MMSKRRHGLSGDMKKFLCWLIGHYPIGPVWEHITSEGSVYPYRCKRCDQLIVFKDGGGWMVWRKNGKR